MKDKKKMNNEEYFDDEITKMFIKDGIILKAHNNHTYLDALYYITKIERGMAISILHYLDEEKTKIIGTDPVMRMIILSPNVDENIKKTIEHILSAT